MSSKNQMPNRNVPSSAKATAAAIVATAAAAPPPQLTEVDPAKGLTPEQLQVAASLTPTISPTSAEAKKERHPDRLKVSEQKGSVKTVIGYVLARKAADPTVSRKQLVSELVDGKAGFKIAFYTARTQVQTALKAMSAKVAPTAAAAKAS